MITKFKKGDHVRLVDFPENRKFPYMEVGSEHVVHKVEDGYVYLVDNGTDGWSPHRFELIDKPAKKRDYVADHARRTLRAAGLSKEEAARFVVNMRAPLNPCRTSVSNISRNLPEPLNSFIWVAFAWCVSNEGFDYWHDIACRLGEETHA